MDRTGQGDEQIEKVVGNNLSKSPENVEAEDESGQSDGSSVTECVFVVFTIDPDQFPVGTTEIELSEATSTQESIQNDDLNEEDMQVSNKEDVKAMGNTEG
jgi:hypothetical protein